MTTWEVDGKAASARDLAEALKLARQHKAKIAAADREARDREATARAVAAALRRQAGAVISCRPGFVRGSSDSTRRLRRFEKMIGLTLPPRVAAKREGGTSSFHFKLTPRGLGQRRRAHDRSYKPGEAARTIRYILRDSAREIPGAGIVSNISLNPDKIASLFAALEELEIDGGRANANVYMSLIVSLPSELTAKERENVLDDICLPLRRQNLPFAGVLHSPDPEGDQRNFHAHVAFSWRPFEMREDRYILSAHTRGAENAPEFVTVLRHNAAAAMNRAMVAAGHTRRFTAEKTRNALAPAAQDKLSAGQKHRQRRAAHIRDADEERSLRHARAELYGTTASAARTWLTRQIMDRSPALSAIVAREAELAAVRPTFRAPQSIASVAEDRTSSRIQAGSRSAVSEGKPLLSEPERVAAQAQNINPVASPPTATPASPTIAPAPRLHPSAATTPSTPATVAERSLTNAAGADLVGSALLHDHERISPSPRSSALRHEDNHTRSHHVYLAALAEVRRKSATSEHDSVQAGRLGAVGTLASLRGVCKVGTLRDLEKKRVLPPGVQKGPSEALAGERSSVGNRHDVRHSRAGDRADQQTNGNPRLDSELDGSHPNIEASPADIKNTVARRLEPNAAPAPTPRRHQVGATDRVRAEARTRMRESKQAVISPVDQLSNGRPRLSTAPEISQPRVRPITADADPPLASSRQPNGAPTSTPRRHHAGSTDRARARERESKQAVISRVELLQWLEQQTYLPVKTARPSDEGPAFTIDRKYATDVADADLLKQAVAAQTDVEVQDLLRRKFKAFLTYLRLELTTRRSERPPSGRLDWLVEGDEQLKSALSAAASSEALQATLEFARNYWNEFDHANTLAAMYAQNRGRDL